MFNNILAILDLMGVAVVGTMIFLDLVTAAKRRLSPIKIPARIHRNRR